MLLEIAQVLIAAYGFEKGTVAPRRGAWIEAKMAG